MHKLTILIILILNFQILATAQKKVLFDATKAETASNADWVIDEDQWNLGYSDGSAYIGGGEGNAQRFPTPDQSNITASTTEDYWTGALSAWGVELVQAGYHVETLPYDGQITYGDPDNPQDLSNYDMFVVCEPNFPFTSDEKTAILNFVHNGGVLFMIADHDNSDRDGDGWDSPAIWNDLMQNNSIQSNPFGITFDYQSINDDTYKIVSDEGTPIIHGPYGTVQNVEFYGGTTMTLDPQANSTVKGLVYQSTVTEVGGTTHVLVAYAFYGQGVVIAVGDSSPFDDGTGDNNDRLYDGWYEDADGNHRIMIMNASVWALSRTVTNLQKANNQDLNITSKYRTIEIYANQPGQISVYNLNGQILKSANIANYLSINDLQPGVYIIKYQNQNGQQAYKVAVF